MIIEQLGQIQHELTHTGAFRDVWNLGTEPRPKSENDISDWLQRQLHRRLTSGLIVDREIQVTCQHPAGIGTRIDLTATAATTSHPPDIARAIIEAKLVNNRALMTALGEQLGSVRKSSEINAGHGVFSQVVAGVGFEPT